MTVEFVNKNNKNRNAKPRLFALLQNDIPPSKPHRKQTKQNPRRQSIRDELRIEQKAKVIRTIAAVSSSLFIPEFAFAIYPVTSALPRNGGRYFYIWPPLFLFARSLIRFPPSCGPGCGEGRAATHLLLFHL